MSNVEIPKIVASAAQFVDVGFHALLALTKLYSDLQNAPKKLKAAGCSLQQLIQLVQITQTDIERPYDDPGLTLSVSIVPHMLLRPSHCSTNVRTRQNSSNLFFSTYFYVGPYFEAGLEKSDGFEGWKWYFRAMLASWKAQVSLELTVRKREPWIGPKIAVRAASLWESLKMFSRQLFQRSIFSQCF